MTGASAQSKEQEMRLPQKEGIAIESSPSVEGQLGVIAKRDYKKGEVIFKVEGPILSEGTRYSFAAGLDMHIEPVCEDGISDFGHYLNHSCDPNVIVRPIHGDGAPRIDVITRRDIQNGEELAFDYATLEYSVTVAGAPCKCGTGTCRSVIQGFKDMPEDEKERYEEEGVIADYLLQIAK